MSLKNNSNNALTVVEWWRHNTTIKKRYFSIIVCCRITYDQKYRCTCIESRVRNTHLYCWPWVFKQQTMIINIYFRFSHHVIFPISILKLSAKIYCNPPMLSTMFIHPSYSMASTWRQFHSYKLSEWRHIYLLTFKI